MSPWDRVADVLASHRDRRGRSPVMTLGVLLSVPDTRRIRDVDCREYYATLMSEPRFASILRAIRRGVAGGVYCLQLHGMKHYWPAALMKAARDQPEVRAWLVQEGVPRTERLPPIPQSRWIDGSVMPSTELPAEEVVAAASLEAEAFAQLFGVAALEPFHRHSSGPGRPRWAGRRLVLNLS